jgi:hypothetical protein
LIDKITVGGKLTDVVYQFQKQINKIKNIIMKKISIVTLALLMTVGFFTSCESLKKHKQNAEVPELSSQWRNNWSILGNNLGKGQGSNGSCPWRLLEE